MPPLSQEAINSLITNEPRIVYWRDHPDGSTWVYSINPDNPKSSCAIKIMKAKTISLHD